jgi:rhamnose utilization protein RhaD (predicted bifunctional aldolase and dehydrogenase)
MPNRRPPEDFLRMSAVVGCNPRHVQGVGGNTSLKRDGVLWIKASGAFLSESLRRNTFAPVDLERLREAINVGAPDPGACVLSRDDEATLRPSIETVFHALLPHRVVVHTHSISVIAATVRRDAEALVAERLAGLSWRFVPYARPGEPIMRAIQGRLEDASADILVLANHGLVVGADNCSDALALLAEVECRLSGEARPFPAPDFDRLASLAASSSYRAPPDIGVHRIGADPDALRIALGGSLYPDHVVFLGRRVVLVDERDPPGGVDGPYLLVAPGAGVLIQRDTPPTAMAMISCLADVLAEIPAGDDVNYLSVCEETALINWEAEKFRRSQNLMANA